MTLLTFAVGLVFVLVGISGLVAPKLRFFREADAIKSEEPGTAERWTARLAGSVLVAGGLLIIYLGQ